MADKEKKHPQTQYDDQLWLNTLAGKKTAGADTPTEKQAEALRRAIAAEQNSVNDDLDQISSRRMRKDLLQRLRDEGLLNSEQMVSRKRFSMYATGVVIIFVALIAYWWMPGYPLLEPGMSNGFPEQLATRTGLEIQRVPVEFPDRAAAHLLSEIKALGLPWRLSRIGDDWLLEIFVTPEPSKKSAEWLKNNRFRIDKSGWSYLLITQGVE